MNFVGAADDDEVWTYGGGLAFPDLGKEGNVLGIFGGAQPYLGGGESGIPNEATAAFLIM